jgi:hypothetical protein
VCEERSAHDLVEVLPDDLPFFLVVEASAVAILKAFNKVFPALDICSLVEEMSVCITLPLREPPASPSVKCTRGSLPRGQHSGKSDRGCDSQERGLPRVPKTLHSGKISRRRCRPPFFLNPLPRVPYPKHSRKSISHYF